MSVYEGPVLVLGNKVGDYIQRDVYSSLSFNTTKRAYKSYISQHHNLFVSVAFIKIHLRYQITQVKKHMTVTRK